MFRAKGISWPVYLVISRRLASTEVASDFLDGRISIEVPGYAGVKPFSAIPGPMGLPFVGSLMDYRFGEYPITQYHHIVADRYRRYGPLVRERIMGRDLVRIFHPNDVQTIFQTEGKTPAINPIQDAVKMYRKLRKLSPGLGNLNGPEWHRLRSAVQQTMMRPQSVKAYLPFVEQVAGDFVEKIRQNRSPETLEVPDFRMTVTKWTLESSGMLIFEKRLGSFNGGTTEKWAESLIRANSEMLDLAAFCKHSFGIHNWISTPKWRRLVELEDYINTETRKQVQETVEKILRNKELMEEGRFNFLGYLLNRKELSMEDIFVVALSLFFDGLNATATTLIFALYNLAKNPRCQEKLYNEIRENIPKNGMIDATVLNKMNYLKACVKETFRIFPNAAEISRVLSKDLVLSGYQVPAGTSCDINIGLILKDEEHFKQANSFIPERWLRDEKDGESEKIHPYLLLPFSHGPRTCVGRRFAEQDIYVMLSRLVQNFEVDYNYGEMGQHYNTLLVPDSSAQFQLRDRREDPSLGIVSHTQFPC